MIEMKRQRRIGLPRRVHMSRAAGTPLSRPAFFAAAMRGAALGAGPGRSQQGGVWKMPFKEWKNSGTARRRFFTIFEKPKGEGVLY